MLCVYKRMCTYFIDIYVFFFPCMCCVYVHDFDGFVYAPTYVSVCVCGSPLYSDTDSSSFHLHFFSGGSIKFCIDRPHFNLSFQWSSFNRKVSIDNPTTIQEWQEKSKLGEGKRWPPTSRPWRADGNKNTLNLIIF